MKCLSCDNQITITTLTQIFSYKPLIICERCEKNLIKKNDTILYETNEWILEIIDRLNQGDIILIEIFSKQFHKSLIKKLPLTSTIKFSSKQEPVPYPWIKILTHQILSKFKHTPNPNAHELTISVHPIPNHPHQISITEI